jgi:hypothetical protein
MVYYDYFLLSGGGALFMDCYLEVVEGFMPL